MSIPEIIGYVLIVVMVAIVFLGIIGIRTLLLIIEDFIECTQTEKARAEAQEEGLHLIEGGKDNRPYDQDRDGA